jgi:DNA-binding NarL/FixJ family response regulator
MFLKYQSKKADKMDTSYYSPVRVAIADDHEIFREGLEVLFKKQKGIELVGQASNGKELIKIAEESHPDVILTDIKMPVIDGIQVTKEIVSTFPGIAVVALTMFDDENLLIDMLEAGAKGYLIKNAHKEEIIAAILAVYKGENYFCNHTSIKLARIIGKSRFRISQIISKPEFTEKETEVIKLICDEYSNKDIADHLHLSIRTIEGYREKILAKMNVKNTAGIVVYAIKHGIYKI